MSGVTEQRICINKRISRNIEYLMLRDGYSQNQLIDIFEEYGLEINQGTFSKCQKRPENNFHSLPVILMCCDIFNVSLEELIKEEIGQNFKIRNDQSIAVNFSKKSQNPQANELLTEINHRAFNGYAGTYYCYLYPTLSSEKNILTGIIKISGDSKDCSVTMDLNVPTKHGNDMNSYCKKYEGQLIISNPLQSCYCILKSDKLSEISFLIFRHIYLNSKQLDCRMSEVLTVSAGESHYPTVHRMFFSREQLKKQDLKLILPMLSMNCSDIILSESDMAALKKEMLIPQEILNQLEKQVTPKSFYVFKENLFRSIVELSGEKKKIPMYISILRDKALKYRYNKVGKKLDDTIRQLLIAQGYYKD